MPMPQFINAIFGAILERNVSIDPAIMQRTDMVTFRTGKPQSASQIFVAAKALLRSYGIAVNDYSGTVRIVPENSQTGTLPEIRRGRALPEVPASLRPIFFLAELEHTNIAQVSNWLRTLFQSRLTVQEDQQRNALLLSGQSDTVSAAMEVIQMLDQPLMRGRLSARIVPVFWSADEMAKRIVEMLQAQGYAAASNAGANTPILVLPVGPVNSIIVFAGNETILNHVLRWAQDLDQSPQGRAGNFINYHVRNTDADDLARTLAEVMGMSQQGNSGNPQAAARPNSSRVVVNRAANILIIQTTPAEFQQWYGLLQELDRPSRSALITATVAEVRLTDDEQFGFQWMLAQFVSKGYNVNVGTSGGVSNVAKDGVFRVGVATLAGDPRGLLTALASSNKIRILSNPSIMARNGQDASIQVGQEVPILTSQVSNANTGSGTGQGILQTIQYRNTGVILRVRPVIHAGGRIDLDVSQEVSAAQKNETGVDSSPIILTRRVETKLSVSDGNTLLLGGLMQEQQTAGNAGIPRLKDIPYVGNLFRTSISDTKERTELVILLTPYIIEDDFDAQSITEAFRNQFAWAGKSVQPALKNTPPHQLDAQQDALAPPEVKNSPKPSQTAPALTYHSERYLLPTRPISAGISNQNVASTQHPTDAPVITQTPLMEATPPLGLGQNIAKSPLPPPNTKPLQDEILKQELLQLISPKN
jgi:general secretion pathway protein D